MIYKNMEIDHFLEKMSFQKETQTKKRVRGVYCCCLVCLFVRGISNAKAWQYKLANYIQIVLTIRGKSSW